MTRLGIDLGGTKTAYGLVSAEGLLLYRRQRPTPRGEAVLDLLIEIIEELIAAAPEDDLSLGIGVPGLINPETGFVQLAINLAWENVPLGTRLEKQFPHLSISFDNDVRTAAMGERAHGAAARYANWIYLSLGTGIASALFLNGRLVYGARHLAGEIGHALVTEDVGTCARGQIGCLEGLASGRALTVEGKTATEVLDLAETGDLWAMELMADFSRYLGRSLGNLIAFIDPEAIVLGGGFGSYPPTKNYVQKAIESHLLPELYADVQIETALLGKNAGIIGAAFLPKRGQA